MKDRDQFVDSQNPESPESSVEADSAKGIEANPAAPLPPESVARRRMRVAGRLLVSLLLGAAATLGSILIFRRGLLPLIEAVFHPEPELLSVLRRTGIFLTALAGYWAFVHWYEKRKATELRLRPIHLLLGGG